MKCAGASDASDGNRRVAAFAGIQVYVTVRRRRTYRGPRWKAMRRHHDQFEGYVHSSFFSSAIALVSLSQGLITMDSKRRRWNKLNWLAQSCHPFASPCLPR